jgi:CobQ-like glutamine amidotransferase family enzyme
MAAEADGLAHYESVQQSYGTGTTLPRCAQLATCVIAFTMRKCDYVWIVSLQTL